MKATNEVGCKLIMYETCLKKIKYKIISAFSYESITIHEKCLKMFAKNMTNYENKKTVSCKWSKFILT